jgi:hypothetical protein
MPLGCSPARATQRAARRWHGQHQHSTAPMPRCAPQFRRCRLIRCCGCRRRCAARCGPTTAASALRAAEHRAGPRARGINVCVISDTPSNVSAGAIDANAQAPALPKVNMPHSMRLSSCVAWREHGASAGGPPVHVTHLHGGFLGHWCCCTWALHGLASARGQRGKLSTTEKARRCSKRSSGKTRWQTPERSRWRPNMLLQHRAHAAQSHSGQVCVALLAGGPCAVDFAAGLTAGSAVCSSCCNTIYRCHRHVSVWWAQGKVSNAVAHLGGCRMCLRTAQRWRRY